VFRGGDGPCFVWGVAETDVSELQPKHKHSTSRDRMVVGSCSRSSEVGILKLAQQFTPTRVDSIACIVASLVS
jgi:hypothetical protein